MGLAVLYSRTRCSVTHWIIKNISIVTFDWIVFSVGAGGVSGRANAGEPAASGIHEAASGRRVRHGCRLQAWTTVPTSSMTTTLRLSAKWYVY